MSRKYKSTLFVPQKPVEEKIYNKKEKGIGIRIGITYLDRKKYGFHDLFIALRGNKQYMQDLNNFILKARQIGDINQFIKMFASHIKIVNNDEFSNAIVKFL